MSYNFLKLVALLVLFQLGNATIQIITRQQWRARPPTVPSSNLKLPVSNAIIAHTASKECTDTEACVAAVRSIQDYHIDARGLGDISFNFLIGGDGLVYEGRGWLLQGTHTLGYNDNSISIAFIGEYEGKEPTRDQLQVAQLLLEQGIFKAALTTNYKLYGHRQLIATASPGTALYNIIKSWPHWSPI